MRAIETRWKGWRFRSRTEARWAVFLEAAGIAFEYESEGVLLPSGPYLPDFLLTEFPRSGFTRGGKRQQAWLEVKGSFPTELERDRCRELAGASGCPVLIAIGAPEFAEQVLLYEPEINDSDRELFSVWAALLAFTTAGEPGDEAICVSRGPLSSEEIRHFTATLTAGGLPKGDYLYSALEGFHGEFGRVLGVENGRIEPGEVRVGLSDKLKAAYDAARGARFEFGQTDKRWDA